MKKIIFLILCLSILSQIKADDANWKLHPTFDEEVSHVVDTPDYVYFTSYGLKSRSTEAFQSLFRYDKKGEELMPLSTSNILNSSSVRDIIYNPSKGYLAVLYKDYNIDLIYNNGKVVAIPFYEQAELSYPKKVNWMAVDAEKDRLYLATDFGYVAINDKKNEIAESRIYGKPLMSFCRLGDKYLAISGNDLIEADVNSPRLSLDQYEKIGSFNDPVALQPINDNTALIIEGSQNPKTVKKLIRNGSDYEFQDLFTGDIYNIENTATGVVLTSGKIVYHIKSDGTLTSIEVPENYWNSAFTTSNLSDFWVGLKRKGLTSIKKSGEQWSVTRDWMLPNSPATYVSTSFVNHPKYGFLMLGYGYRPATLSFDSFVPMQLSGYRNGRWTNYAPAYTNPAKTDIMTTPSGIAIDPDNNKYAYLSSYHNGIMRINLEDPTDFIHFIRKGDFVNSDPDYIEIQPQQNSSKGYWNITAPYFDSKGNLWMAYANHDQKNDPKPRFYCWLAEDRKASASASNAKAPQMVEFDVNFPGSNNISSIPLLKTGNGLLVYAAGLFYESLGLMDTNGTPIDTKDDKTYIFTEFIDSDGNTVDAGTTKYLWEDPDTGYVWVCHANGVFYFVPSQVRQGNYQIYRIKVSRNDGTNLADYLLDGVTVNHLAVDSEGRKWFATAGGGVICTTPDGREILEEFTKQNSPLPNDVVYGIGYNSDTNSLFFSTDQGYAEYMLPVSSSSSVKADIRAYPNPVRPNYSGYVTITDIPQGSFVKITDSAGNLVKELGIMSGFEILWDISDANFNRVKSGVYHIMVSPSDESSSYSTVGKILVVS